LANGRAIWKDKTVLGRHFLRSFINDGVQGGPCSQRVRSDINLAIRRSNDRVGERAPLALPFHDPLDVL
jgi:hypothetical protein